VPWCSLAGCNDRVRNHAGPGNRRIPGQAMRPVAAGPADNRPATTPLHQRRSLIFDHPYNSEYARLGYSHCSGCNPCRLQCFCAPGSPVAMRIALVIFAGCRRKIHWPPASGDLVSSGCRAGALQELFQRAEVARDRCFDSWDG
jgi:hypothetical protein